MDNATWELRAAQPGDEAFLRTLYFRLHAHEFAAHGMPGAELETLLDLQARAQRLGYLRDFPSALSHIVTAAGEPIGRLLVDYGAAAVQLVDIALLPESQGRGIGSALLTRLLAEAAALAQPLQLSVNPANPALRLYTRMGFQVIGGGLQLLMERTPDGLPGTQRSALPPPAALGQASFERLTGHHFHVSDPPCDVLLHRVDPRGHNSFSVIFHGALEPLLPQQIYQLEDTESGAGPASTLQIFLVPIGPIGETMQYEAVFNL